MPRVPRAASQLVQQVTEVAEASDGIPAVASVSDDPDGYGVHRTLLFDSETAKWLTPMLVAFDDERIATMEDRDGQLAVTFVADIRADYADPYPFDEVLAVFAEFDDDEASDDEPERGTETP